MLDFLKRFRLIFAALFFLFLALLILVMNAREGREATWMERLALRISAPLQQQVQGMILWVRGMGEHYLFLAGVQRKNQELKREISALREENNRLKETILAEKRLERLSAYQAKYSSTAIVAQVFARDPSNWFKTILVNKGEEDGVAKDMAVITADGVVGRVMEVTSTVAKVLQITDPNSALDVLVQRSRCQGIMEGRIKDLCILKYVQKSDDIQVGDAVVTSGMGGIFPKGLLIGTVSTVDRKRPGIFQYVEVKPSVDFSRLEEVLIVAEEP